MPGFGYAWLSRWNCTRLSPGRAELRGLFCRFRQFGQFRSHAFGVIRVHLLEMPKLAIHDGIRRALHRLGDIGKETVLLPLVKQVEQRAGVDVVIVPFPVVMATGIAPAR